MKRRRWRIAGLALIGLAVLFGLDYEFYQRLFPAGGASFDSGRNGLWVKDDWYLGQAKESYAALARRVSDGGFQDVYLHVRYIEKNGQLHYRYWAQGQIVAQNLRWRVPGARAIAWIYAGNERGLTGIDLGNATVRATMVKQAVDLVTWGGFDGVQWDYEMCPSGDANFLKLLQQTRAALPQGKVLSVAAPMWLPRPLEDLGWSEAYFSQVAARCDQVAVMAYDSGVRWPRGYVWLLKQQCVRVPRACQAGNPKCEVLMGLPTYEDGGFSHSAWCENLELGLKGVREAGPQAGLAGVALFADYTTDAKEWRVYHSLWR